MILVALVAVLWILVLAPSAVRRWNEQRNGGSIDHFHHQLQTLEHAGPKTVAPAYRLHTAVPGGASIESPFPASLEVDRPKLVLLRPIGEGTGSGSDGVHYERVGRLASPEPPRCQSETRAELAAYRRVQARQRCTTLLRVLMGITLVTAGMGVVPSLRLAWIFTGVSGLLALGVMGLIAYAREIEAQQEHRQRRLAQAGYEREDAVVIVDDSDYPDYGAAEAGHPGAWDDEEVVPRHAAAGH